MSEHMSIKGVVDFWHLPYDWKGCKGLVYCERCKKVSDNVKIKLDEGFYVSVICGFCNKTIWTGQVLNPRFVIDDLKCSVCKKKTNDCDCAMISSCFVKDKLINMIACSGKCAKKLERDIIAKIKKEEKLMQRKKK